MINDISTFTIAGTISKKILIFDIDDTIIYSNATVGVRKNGKIIKELTAQEFNTYSLKDNELFDFRNFDSSVLLGQAKLTKYWDTLSREYFKGTHISILTARSRPAMIKKFFMNKGIDIKDELIFCCGYSKFPWKGTVQYKKRKVIEYLISLGYEVFVFFDDNEQNLLEAKNLEKEYNIKVNIVHVEN